MEHRTKEVPVLNGIRGFAALAVFASHAANVCFQGKLIGNGGGQLGVMLFYLLSGFLMAMLYMAKEPTTNAQWNFAVNRFARIYPMYFAVVVASFLLSHSGLHVGTYSVITKQELIEHLLVVRGYSVFWTIGPEIIFYGLFMVLWFTKHRSPITFYVLLCAALIVSTFPGPESDANSLLALHQRLPYFLVGMLIGMHYERIQQFGKRLPKRASRIVFALSLALFVASCPGITKLLIPLPPINPFPMWSYPFYLITVGSMFLASIVTNPWLLTNKVANFYGKISFSYYLLHVAILITLYPLYPTHPARVLVGTFVLTTVMAWICHVSVEKPCRSAIRKLLGNRQVTREVSYQAP